MATFPIALPVHPLQYERLLRRALEEDLGLAGDLTTNAVVPPGERLDGRIVARRPGCIAGLQVAARAFTLVDPEVKVSAVVADGALVEAGAVLANVAGPARAILTGERVALNVLGHLSGVATVTRGIV
ncbi:MAG TPA: nicotinate-nucleotide diphosphorylase (carboxylating), partial [Thermoanaerobaculia bacterium]|nr:nicotinate-nucleotide diphosphorylase (carboxylating) [Thermoanaerobaculia bacterium]